MDAKGHQDQQVIGGSAQQGVLADGGMSVGISLASSKEKSHGYGGVGGGQGGEEGKGEGEGEGEDDGGGGGMRTSCNGGEAGGRSDGREQGAADIREGRDEGSGYVSDADASIAGVLLLLASSAPAGKGGERGHAGKEARSPLAMADEMDEKEKEEAAAAEYEHKFGSSRAEPVGSRKQRALGYLCEQFLKVYSAGTEAYVEDVATMLRVERRRIYDIMNALEAVHIVSKGSSKKHYICHGSTRLRKALEQMFLRGPLSETDQCESDGEKGEDAGKEARSPVERKVPPMAKDGRKWHDTAMPRDAGMLSGAGCNASLEADDSGGDRMNGQAQSAAAEEGRAAQEGEEGIASVYGEDAAVLTRLRPPRFATGEEKGAAGEGERKSVGARGEDRDKRFAVNLRGLVQKAIRVSCVCVCVCVCVCMYVCMFVCMHAFMHA